MPLEARISSWSFNVCAIDRRCINGTTHTPTLTAFLNSLVALLETIIIIIEYFEFVNNLFARYFEQSECVHVYRCVHMFLYENIKHSYYISRHSNKTRKTWNWPKSSLCHLGLFFNFLVSYRVELAFFKYFCYCVI